MRAVRHNYRRKRAIFDLDSIIVNLMDPWLAWYNAKYDDTVKLADIKTYHIENYVKCGMGIFKFFNPAERYGDCPIYEGAAEGLLKLHENDVDVVIATATAGSTAPQKYVLAKKAAPWLDKHHIIIGTRKELLHGDFFTDDAPKNMLAYSEEWPDAEILTIGFPYNEYLRDKVDFYADDCFNPKKAWEQIVDYILSVPINSPTIDERIVQLEDEVQMWKRRASSHGCNTEEGDDDCG